MLCVAIEFLTGYYVATHPSARDRAEWPPHPARVFMAMAAAYFETGEDPGEKVALEFIEALPASPVIFASCAEHRSPVTHYVPVNDKLDPTGAAFPILRSRQPREFPRVRPENPVVYFSWPDAAVDGDMLAALASLCQKVTRIGHSSSLVRVWVCSDPPGDPDRYEWIADEAGIGEQLRLITPGSLAELRGLYRSADMAEFDRLENTIEGAKGVAKKTAKQEMATRFGGHRPQPVRPEFQITANYRIRTAHAVGAVRTIWDAGLFIASLEPPEHSRRRLDILSSPVLVRSLHKAMIKVAQQFGSVPEYISGHKPDGTPSESPHCVVFPLPFVGREHADGHILGVSVAMPVRATAADRHMVGKVLNGISKNGIQLGGLGKWGFALVGMPSPLLALRRETWLGGGHGARVWASVTPVVFDEHPKGKDIDSYQSEVRSMLAKACLRIGLPEPERIDISHVSFIAGVPTAYEFPRLARKDGSTRRQLHVRVKFAVPVVGPLLVGAGRYRGYGLFRPLSEGRQGE